MRLYRACKLAKARSKRANGPVYVVWVPEDRTYDHADDYDLDTHYNGLGDNNISAVYEDGRICE